MIEHTLEQPKTTTPRTKGAQNTRSIRGVNYTKEGFELIARIFFLICAIVAIVAVLSITLYMILRGTPALAEVGIKELLFETLWQPTAATPSYGIAFIIFTSIVGTFFAILLDFT